MNHAVQDGAHVDDYRDASRVMKVVIEQGGATDADAAEALRAKLHCDDTYGAWIASRAGSLRRERDGGGIVGIRSTTYFGVSRTMLLATAASPWPYAVSEK
jgi:hypothetical protein